MSYSKASPRPYNRSSRARTPYQTSRPARFSPRDEQPRGRSGGRSNDQREPNESTSWGKVAPWYNKLVGSDGHYYHEHVVMPGVLKLLHLSPEDSLIDLGCGQGILSRRIPPIQNYHGIDIAEDLIKEAERKNKKAQYTFQTGDVSRIIRGAEPIFSHAAIILALQNIQEPKTALKNAANFLIPGGKLVITINHPCFRIPRQSGWNTDEKTKLQSRWINRYMSSMKIPINMHPGKQEKTLTWSFHHSLQDISTMLQEAGFVIAHIEEWTSDKESEGRAAKMENRARAEIPLFMTIVAEKK